MIREEKTIVVQLTRDLAERYATMTPWKGDRPLKKDRVNMLLAKIAKGLFHSPHWAIAILGDKTIRMNGQHSSNALMQCEKFPEGLQVTIQRFSVDNEEDVATLFDQFDNPVSSRGVSDIVRAHASTDIELHACSKRVLQSGIAGIIYAKFGTRKSDISERARILHHYKDFILYISKYANSGQLLVQPVVAAMLLTYTKDKVASDEFWTLVENESHVDTNHPTRVLAKFLNMEVYRNSGSKWWDRRAILVKCIHAWTAYRRKTTTALKYTPSAPIPEII